MNCFYCLQKCSIDNYPVNHWEVQFCKYCKVVFNFIEGEDKEIYSIVFITNFNQVEYRFILLTSEKSRKVLHGDANCKSYIFKSNDGIIMRFPNLLPITPQNVNNKIRTYLTFQ